LLSVTIKAAPAEHSFLVLLFRVDVLHKALLYKSATQQLSNGCYTARFISIHLFAQIMLQNSHPSSQVGVAGSTCS